MFTSIIRFVFNFWMFKYMHIIQINPGQKVPGQNVPGHNVPDFGNICQIVPGQNGASKKKPHSFKYETSINNYI